MLFEFKQSDKVICIIDLMQLYNHNKIELDELYKLYPDKNIPKVGNLYCVDRVESDSEYGQKIFLVGFPEDGVGFLSGIFMNIHEFQKLDPVSKRVYLNQ